MIVTQAAFDEHLRAVESSTPSPAAGLYGPGSLSWQICRESLVFLGAGRAALLQLSHPYVAHAIDQHSQTRADPIGRFNRTFLHVYSMIFGDLEHALGAARRVRTIHDGVHGAIEEDVGRFQAGHRYGAHDPGALLWVHATLIETAVMTYELGLGPLSAAEKDEYYQQTKRFAGLFGLGDETLPRDWQAFSAYCEAMRASDTLAVGRPAREIGEFLFTAPRPSARPMMRWYRIMTAGLLTPRLREQWGFAFGRAERLVYGASLRAIRAGWPHIPGRLRYVPAYFEALGRLEGHPGPDRFGRTVEQLLLRFVKPRRGEGSGCPVPH